MSEYNFLKDIKEKRRKQIDNSDAEVLNKFPDVNNRKVILEDMTSVASYKKESITPIIAITISIIVLIFLLFFLGVRLTEPHVTTNEITLPTEIIDRTIINREEVIIRGEHEMTCLQGEEEYMKCYKDE